MAEAGKVTTDHDEIRRWAERHGGRPAAVRRTGQGDDPGILRIDFPGFSGEQSLKRISWEEFFRWFDANELALVHRPNDRFNKLISRDSASARTRSARSRAGGARARTKPARAGGRAQTKPARAGGRAQTKQARGAGRAKASQARAGGGSRAASSRTKAKQGRAATARRQTGQGRAAAGRKKTGQARAGNASR